MVLIWIAGVNQQNLVIVLENGCNPLVVQAFEVVARGISELYGVIFKSPLAALERDHVVDLA